MSRDEFLDLLLRFADRPLPALAGRHIYLWHGEVEHLTSVLPLDVLRRLDLHTLAVGLPQAPGSIDAARRLLLQTLRSHLKDLLASDRQLVLLVTGCDLLSRYRVPLGPFYEIVSERIMAVLALPLAETRFRPVEPIPEYVSLDADAAYEYLRSAIGSEFVINTAEESS